MTAPTPTPTPVPVVTPPPPPPAPLLPRVLGAATAAYSAALLVRPGLLARPCGFAVSSDVPRPVGVLIRGIAVRDLADGVAMVLAPRGPALTAALGVRVASDLGDAVVFGAGLTGRRAPKIAGFAAVWGGLCAVAAATSR